MKLTQTIAWSPFSGKHKNYINTAFTSRICVAEGAIRSGKTIDHCIIAANYLETCRDKIHLASGSTIGNAKLNIGVCNGFGLENLFRGRCHWGKYKGNEALIIQTKTGEKIVVFAGGGKSDSYKRILGNSYGLWIATEINEHYDSDDSRESFVKVAFGRQVAAQDRLVLWDLNPCNPNHRIYQDYIDKYLEDELPGYLYEHFTIDDNLSISDERREELKAQYDPNSVWYKRDILGVRCIAEGLVYPMFSEETHVIDDIPWQALQRGEWYISLDYGTVNPFAAGLWCIYQGAAYMVQEYYYNSRAEGQKVNARRTDDEHYAEVEKLAGNRNIERIIVDPSAASFIETIRRNGKFSALNADNSVLDGIRRTAALLNAGRIKIHRSCRGIITEFGQYQWDMDAPEDAVIKENDHCLTGDTIIHTIDGPRRIDELVGKRGRVWSYNVKRKKAQIRPFFDVRMTRENAQIYKITLEGGRIIRCTGEHRILTNKGYIRAKYLKESDCIIDIMDSMENTPRINTPLQSGVKTVKIAAVDLDGVEPVYNMEVLGNHNFAVNGGLIVHNCMDALRYLCYTILWR